MTQREQRVGGAPRSGAGARRLTGLALLLAAAAVPACAASEYAAQADAEVAAVLDTTTEATLGDRAERLQWPVEEVGPESDAVGAGAPVEVALEGAAPTAETTGAAPASGAAPPPAAEFEAAALPPAAGTGAADAAVGDAPVGPELPEPLPAPGVAGEGPAQPPLPADARPAGGQDVRALGLEEALRTAFVSSREFITRRETLYLQGLGLTRVRFDFGPQLRAAVAHLYADAEDASSSHDTSGFLGLSQILPTGGTFRLDSGLDRFHVPGDDSSHTSSVDVSLSQPLLRGAGYEVSHEALTQAERDIVYAVRDFELFRQDFMIQIASGYFELVRQRTQLANEERNYRDAVFDREKAEALRLVDRNEDDSVFLARRREIDAETRLLNARADYEVAVDSFRIRLGLPKEVVLDIREEDPPFERVRLDADSAVAAALANRLDLITARERLDDSERQVRLAKDDLLPSVDLGLRYRLAGESEHVTDAGPDRWSSEASLAVEIPLQRTPERNVYRATLIEHDRALRDHELLLENTERDVRDSLRQLHTTEKQIALQEQQIVQEHRAVAVTEIRFESGDADNRDLLDARQALFDAENELIRLQVDHFIGRLRLYRDLGLLFVEPDGMWRS